MKKGFFAFILVLFTCLFCSCNLLNKKTFSPDFAAIKDFAKYQSIGVGSSTQINGSRAVVSESSIDGSALVGQLEDGNYEVVTVTNTDGEEETTTYNVGYFENHDNIALFGIHEPDDTDTEVSSTIDTKMDTYNYVLNKDTGKIYSIDDYAKVKSVTEIGNNFVFSATKSDSRAVFSANQDVYKAYFNDEQALVIETIFDSDSFPVNLDDVYFCQDNYGNIFCPFFYIKHDTTDIVKFDDEQTLLYGFDGYVYNYYSSYTEGQAYESENDVIKIFNTDCVEQDAENPPSHFMNIERSYDEAPYTDNCHYELLYASDDVDIYWMDSWLGSDVPFGLFYKIEKTTTPYTFTRMNFNLGVDSYYFEYNENHISDGSYKLVGSRYYQFVDNYIFITDLATATSSDDIFKYALKQLNSYSVDSEGTVVFSGVKSNLDAVEGYITKDLVVSTDITTYTPPVVDTTYIYSVN